MTVEVSTAYDQLRAKASSARLSELVPLLLMLAKDLKRRDLEAWCKLELDGYLRSNPELTEGTEVPEYRSVAGQWSNEHGQPLVITDAELIFVNSYRLRNGVAELEHLGEETRLQTLVDPGMSNIIRESLQVEVRYFSFSPREVLGVLSSIRIRLIEILLLSVVGPETSIQLCSAEEVVAYNQGYNVEEFLPGWFAIGSNGGGEMLAIRKRDGSPCPVYMVPFIPMAESDAIQIAHDFEMFAMALGRDGAEA